MARRRAGMCSSRRTLVCTCTGAAASNLQLHNLRISHRNRLIACAQLVATHALDIMPVGARDAGGKQRPCCPVRSRRVQLAGPLLRHASHNRPEACTVHVMRLHRLTPAAAAASVFRHAAAVVAGLHHPHPRILPLTVAAVRCLSFPLPPPAPHRAGPQPLLKHNHKLLLIPLIPCRGRATGCRAEGCSGTRKWRSMEDVMSANISSSSSSSSCGPVCT